MQTNKDIISKYTQLKENGMSPEQIFNQAKIDGYKNFECINLLMVIFNMSLDEARKISQNFYKENDIHKETHSK